jgi:hypothetical protein
MWVLFAIVLVMPTSFNSLGQSREVMLQVKSGKKWIRRRWWLAKLTLRCGELLNGWLLHG